MVTTFKVGLKSLLQRSLSEPEFYGDLVYKLRKIIGRAIFLISSEKLSCVTNDGYNINIMRQSAVVLHIMKLIVNEATGMLNIQF